MGDDAGTPPRMGARMRRGLFQLLAAVLLAGCTTGVDVPSPTGGVFPTATPSDETADAATPTPQPFRTLAPTATVPLSSASADDPTMAPIPSLAATMIPIEPAAVRVVADPSLARLLPHDINGLQFTARDLSDGQEAPFPLDGDRLREFAGLASGRSARVSLSWIQADPATDARTGGIRVSAVRVEGVSGIDLVRSAIALEVLGTSAPALGDARLWAVGLGGLRSIAFAHGDALILVAWAGEELPRDAWSPDAVFRSLPAPDAIQPVAPSVPPAPPSDAGLPPPAPAAEAMLPRVVAGVPLRYYSAAGRDVWANVLAAIDAYGLLLGGLAADPDRFDVAAGLGPADGSPLGSYIVTMTHVPGASRDALVKAWFANLTDVAGRVEIVDIAGRPLLLYAEDRRAVYATQGRLYSMQLFSFVDTPEVPPGNGLTVRDLAIDTVRQLPAAADGG
jgi:hypothetical protein